MTDCCEDGNEPEWTSATTIFTKMTLNWLFLLFDDMEGSYKPNDVKIEYSMACNSNNKAIVALETLRKVYFAYIQSIISYGIIFGGKSSI